MMTETPPGPASPAERVVSRRRRVWRWLVRIPLALMLAWYIWPLINPHWAQDRCSFGRISKDEYRALLARAKALAAAESQDQFAQLIGHGNDEGVAAIWQSQLEGLLPSNAPSELQVAAVHAVLRANGAVYKFSSLDQLSQFATSLPTIVNLKYIVNINRFNILRSYKRWALITVSVHVENIRDHNLMSPGQRPEIVVDLPGLLATDRYGESRSNCPPVPPFTLFGDLR